MAYNVDLVRHYDVAGSLITSVTATFANGAFLLPQFPASAAIDGDDSSVYWQTTDPLDSDAAARLVFDLGEPHRIGRIRQTYDTLNVVPVSVHVRASVDSSNWTTVLDETAITARDTTTDVPSTLARFVELTATGTLEGAAVLLDEFYVYPAVDDPSPPTTNGGFDLTYLPSVSATIDANLVGPGAQLFDKGALGVYGRTIAQGARADGIINVDLGAQYRVNRVALHFRLLQNWVNGGRVEVSADGTNWSTEADTMRGTALGALGLGFAPTTIRYIRITDYFNATGGVGTGLLSELEVFGVAP